MTDPAPFDSTTPRYALPLLFAGQAQKEGFVNEIAARIDALIHCAIEGLATAPPSAPEEGQCWLVGAGGTGAWLDRDHEIAAWQGGNWLFFAPSAGLSLYDKSAGQLRHFIGSWLIAPSPGNPTGGAIVDAEARAAIAEIIEVLEISGLVPTI